MNQLIHVCKNSMLYVFKLNQQIVQFCNSWYFHFVIFVNILIADKIVITSKTTRIIIKRLKQASARDKTKHYKY